MVYFILKRLIQSVFVMLAVAFLAFSLFRFVGDPITQMTGVETSVADQERLRDELGLNDPFIYQFARFTGDMLKGDFGFSLYRIKTAWGANTNDTDDHACGCLDSDICHRDHVDFCLRCATWMAPHVRTRRHGSARGVGDILSHLRRMARPIATRDYAWCLSTYADHAPCAGRDDGSDEIRLHSLCHGAWMVPVITIIGLQFGGVIAFSIVTESVFQWPGMGLLFLESIRFVDIPVMGVYLVVIAFFFVLVNLVVDLLYVAIDPRLRIRDVT